MKYLMNTYNRFEPTFVRGKGCWLYDKDNNKYLDFVSGIAVNALGHSHPKIVETLKTQGDTLIHLSNLYYNDKQDRLAEKLISLSDHKKVFFCNSGTEAIEGAMKLARKYGNEIHKEKKEIIYMENSFHGRSIGALSITGQAKYQTSFKPLVPDVYSVKYNDIESLKKRISSKSCAVIIEPIQGESGLIKAKKKYLEDVKLLCEKYDVLLIFDEIQCGIGRGGSFYFYEEYGVIPDIVCMAKGLGGGFPIGAIIAGEKAEEVFIPGDHGTTFGGNPLACAVSLVVIEEIEKLLDDVKKKSKYIIEKLEGLKKSTNKIEEICGIGLLLGLKVKGIEVSEVIKQAFDNKLLLVGAGNNVVRFLPPLNVKYEEIDLAIEKLSLILRNKN